MRPCTVLQLEVCRESGLIVYVSWKIQTPFFGIGTDSFLSQGCTGSSRVVVQSVFRSKDYTTVWFDTAPSARPFPVLTKLEGLSYNATDSGKLANCNPTGIIHKYKKLNTHLFVLQCHLRAVDERMSNAVFEIFKIYSSVLKRSKVLQYLQYLCVQYHCNHL